MGGHSGVHATTKRLTTYFYWKGLRKMVKEWVRTCDVCQRNKSDFSAYPVLLQPLPIPDKIWQDLSMDFIEYLSMSQGKSALLVVVDRLLKYSHFLPITHPYTASQVAQLFLDHVYKLHGLPKTIVSDRDKIFMSHFWQSLFKMLQVRLKLSTTYHPQTDRQTHIVNKCLETYLRCMTGEAPKDWVKWVPLAEYWYNTNFHSALNTTPYEVVYGQAPPLHIPYTAKDSSVEDVDRTLQAREKVIQLLKFNLKKAQDRMKSQADKRRSDRSFEVNDWVYLKLQPYRQLTVRQGRHHKLSSKFFGPFQVLAKIGKVAYKLKLPESAKVHPVFHVSQLKPCYSDSASMGSFPLCDHEGLLAATPFKLLDRRMVKQNNRLVVFGLIQWSNRSEEDATWERLDDLLTRFPEFTLDP
ncbi:putative mitochondrial protein [Tanacetum coccineum]